MGKILTWGCKVKPRGVPKNWPISQTGRANVLKQDCSCNIEFINQFVHFIRNEVLSSFLRNI